MRAFLIPFPALCSAISLINARMNCILLPDMHPAAISASAELWQITLSSWDAQSTAAPHIMIMWPRYVILREFCVLIFQDASGSACSPRLSSHN
eukprot:1778937-Prymnesium_polylepis.2